MLKPRGAEKGDCIRRCSWLRCLFRRMRPSCATGSELQFVAMPSVILAARWGTAGFYLLRCALCMELAVVSTAARPSFAARAAIGRRTIWRLGARILALSALFALSGFDFLVRSLYPLLGWLCAMALLALTAFVDWPKRVKFLREARHKAAGG